MAAVGEIEDPEAREVVEADVAAAGRSVQTSSSKSRFAVRIRASVEPVAVEQLHDRHARRERIGQRLGRHKSQIVGGRVILRKLAPHASHQTADGEVEPRRAELPLIIPVGGELTNLVRDVTVPENVRDGAVDLGVATAALLVMKTARVADAGQHESVLDAGELTLVAREPTDRTNRSWNEEEPVRIASWSL